MQSGGRCVISDANLHGELNVGVKHKHLQRTKRPCDSRKWGIFDTMGNEEVFSMQEGDYSGIIILRLCCPVRVPWVRYPIGSLRCRDAVCGTVAMLHETHLCQCYVMEAVLDCRQWESMTRRGLQPQASETRASLLPYMGSM